MSKLGLSITANYFVFDSFLKIKLFVLFIAHKLDVFDEHNEVRECWNCTWRYQDFIDCEKMGVCIFVFVVLIVVIGKWHVSVGIFYELEPTLVEKIGSIVQIRCSLEKTFHV